MIDKDYVISAVSEETKPISTQFGSLIVYKIKLERETDVISLNQKPETPAPTVGQKLFGHLEPSPYGMKFKKVNPLDGGIMGLATKAAQPVLSGFTDDDRKMLKEIHSVICAGMPKEEKPDPVYEGDSDALPFN